MEALLPVRWYVDDSIFKMEMDALFTKGPGYVGHELMVPRVGDYHPVEAGGKKKLILTRSKSGVEVLVNACRHRQAVMVDVPGSSKNLTCPYHNWTYSMDGTLLGAPHFAENPCKNLFKVPTTTWNGLILSGPASVGRDLADWGAGSVFDFNGYRFHRSLDMQCKQNWKTFVEVYLDLYHVAPFHPGLSSLVTCSNLKWDMGEFWSVQTVGMRPGSRPASTPAWEAWRQKVLQAYDGSLPDKGAVWLFYYPNLMLEWNPGSIVVSVLQPVSPGLTVNHVEFYYDSAIIDSIPGYVEAHQTAYFETAAEDEVLGNMMDQGRESLIGMGRDDVGPIQSPMEDGIAHFHRYVLWHVRDE